MNIKIEISYEGTKYSGWQKQKNSLGIQGEIELAIEKATGKKVSLVGSGRTDAGVHAISQVANFDVDTTIPIEKMAEVITNFLPKDISIKKAEEVEDNFHARFSAHRKTYRYQMYVSRIRNPFLVNRAYQLKYDIDVEKMKKESKSLLGEHDFCGFMSSGSSVKSTVRTIFDIDIFTQREMVVIEICGNGFLYNMVRIITGTLIDIGRGKINDSMDEILESKDRSMAGHTAPACGLYLKSVEY